MAAKAHEISLEAGSKMAAAMKDVVNAAAGLSGFVLESARDLVQYMVRRGQMTQEEADKLIREVEAFQPKRKAGATPIPTVRTSDMKKSVAAAHTARSGAATPVRAAATQAHPARSVKKAAAKPASKKPATKGAHKPAARKPVKKAKAPARSSAKAKRR
jgi:polyhydroxyalkanoate synthesis regulator phasin